MFQARRRFNPREDGHLKRLVEQYGTRDWKLISRKMKNRTPKQCRDRYVNYLASSFKSSEWTKEEDDTLCDLVRMFGTRWNMIHTVMGERAPNHLKNRWHKVLSLRDKQGVEWSSDDNVPTDLGWCGTVIDQYDFEELMRELGEECLQEEATDSGETNVTSNLCQSQLACNN